MIFATAPLSATSAYIRVRIGHSAVVGLPESGQGRVKLHMPLHWLCYRHNNQISVVIEPGSSLIHARMRAALANLDEGEFTEGHELDRKWKVAKEMVGRRLSQEEAKRLLAKFE